MFTIFELVIALEHHRSLDHETEVIGRQTPYRLLYEKVHIKFS